MDELLTATQVAKYLSLRPSTIKLWTRDGVIPCIRINSKIIRYDQREVDRALRARGAEVEAAR